MLVSVPEMVVVIVAHAQPDVALQRIKHMLPNEEVLEGINALEMQDRLSKPGHRARLFTTVGLYDFETLQSIRAMAKKAYLSVRLVIVRDEPIANLKQWQQQGIKNLFTIAPSKFAELRFAFETMPADHTDQSGPFDIIGDIHGCFDELVLLLQRMQYAVTRKQDGSFEVHPPAGRKVIFLGDLGDRGPDSPAVFQLAMDMIDADHAYCVLGNHDFKLLRHLEGHEPKPTHGFQITLAQLEAYDENYHQRLRQHLEAMPTHLVLDEGKLVVCHAGLPENMHYRNAGKVKSHAVFGRTTGEYNEQGFPIRVDWAKDYSGNAMVVYGHTPIEQTRWANRTLCLDTACAFGGSLTALRYPELEQISVKAKACYYRVHNIATQP